MSVALALALLAAALIIGPLLLLSWLPDGRSPGSDDPANPADSADDPPNR